MHKTQCKGSFSHIVKKEVQFYITLGLIIKSSQIRTPYEENLNLSPTETKTLVPTKTSLGQRIHIENDVLQMREKMIEKFDKVWTCKVCEFSSHNSGHMREHVEKHLEGVEYPCNLQFGAAEE